MVQPLFEESQRVSGLVVLAVAAILAIVWALLLWKVGSRPRVWVYLAAVTLFISGLLAMMHMQTTVDREKVTVSLFYLFDTSVPLQDIAASQATGYAPLRDFGGWGLRFGPQGRAYSMRGDAGVRLTLSDGRTLLLGSQRPEALQTAIETARQQNLEAPNAAAHGR